MQWRKLSQLNQCLLLVVCCVVCVLVVVQVCSRYVWPVYVLSFAFHRTSYQSLFALISFWVCFDVVMHTDGGDEFAAKAASNEYHPPLSFAATHITSHHIAAHHHSLFVQLLFSYCLILICIYV